MYENTYFRTRAEAYADLLKDTKNGIKHRWIASSVQDALRKLRRAIWLYMETIGYWVAARTIGRFIMKTKLWEEKDVDRGLLILPPTFPEPKQPHDNSRHRELCRLAGKWLRKPKFGSSYCPYVAVELVTANPETPDVFGVELLGYGSYRSEGFAFRLLGRCKKEFPPAAGRRRRGLSVLLQSRRIDNRSRFAG